MITAYISSSLADSYAPKFQVNGVLGMIYRRLLDTIDKADNGI